LSPLVASALSNDATIEEFEIKDSDSRLLDLVRNLILGASIIVEKAEWDTLKTLYEGLGNTELCEQILTFRQVVKN
jgi:hypothetical protein